MDIIGGISAATEGLKLVNELRKIDKELDKAELKLRLVDVADKLLDSKQALQDARDTEATLRDEIEELKRKLHEKAHLEDENGFLYMLDDDGKRIGEPFCNLCNVKEGRLYRMRHIAPSVGRKEGYLCDNCDTFISTGPALPSPTVPVNRRR
jgi:uncharacterized Fe-S cluster-containing protein